jgi:hypothetical protein
MNIKHFLPLVTAVLAVCADCRADIVITLDSTRFDNANWTSISYGGGSLGVRGTLTGVSVDVTLVDGSPNTLASDIGIMVYQDRVPWRLAQVGGGFDFYSLRHYTWATGHSDIVGTRCVDTVHLDPPLTFVGDTYFPDIAMGVFSANWPNGAWATWTGTMTLIGLERVSDVPSPASSVFWLAAGALSRRGRKRGNT